MFDAKTREGTLRMTNWRLEKPDSALIPREEGSAEDAVRSSVSVYQVTGPLGVGAQVFDMAV